MQGIIDAILGALSQVPPQLTAFIISMVPIIELRGALPIALGMHLPYWQALPLCIIGNLIPVPFILWLITPIFTWMKKTKLFRPLVEKLEAKTLKKKSKLDKGVFWGLVLFVGIPLPGTGAWTGALLASLLNVPFKKAMPAIALGVLLAAGIMTLVSFGLLGALGAIF